MWNAIWRKFCIICASKLNSIAARVINKSFIEFATIEKYYCIYQKVYHNIASELANKNKNKYSTKHHKVLLQGAMLDKLPKTYASLTLAMNKNLLDYIHVDLCNTIYQIIQYFKNKLLKVLHLAFATSYNIKANPNKQ